MSLFKKFCNLYLSHFLISLIPHFSQLIFSFAGTAQPRIRSRGRAGDSEPWSLGKATEIKKTLQNREAADRSSSANETKMENYK